MNTTNMLVFCATVLVVASFSMGSTQCASTNSTMVQPELKRIRDEICAAWEDAEKSMGELKRLHRRVVLKWMVEFQNKVVGPRIYKWLNEAVKANASLISGILLTGDSAHFLDMLNYMQYGDPNPFVNAKELINPCKYITDLTVIIDRFQNTFSALMAQLWLKNFSSKLETDIPGLIKEFIGLHKKTFDFLRKRKRFAHLFEKMPAL